MRSPMLPAAVLVMTLSSVALAQGSGSGSTSPGSSSTTPSSSSSASQSQSMQSGSMRSGSSQQASRSFEQIKSSLEKAGIQNLQALDASYLVSATSQDGEPVTFVIDPPGAMAAAGSGGASSGSSSGASGGQQASMASQQEIKQSLTTAGFTDVQIMQATYLARGTTKKGEQVTMMIESGEAEAALSGRSSGSQSPSGSQSGSQRPGGSGQ